MTKQKAIEVINSSYSSIWSKDDVLKLINTIDEGSIGDEFVKQLIETICDSVEDTITDIEMIDESNCTFTICNGNEISIDDISVNTVDIIKQVKYDVTLAINEFFEK